jgi:hypothetical protein
MEGLRQLTDGKPWIILKQCEQLPGDLCETTELESAGLAELDRVSAGGWLEEPGTRRETERGTRKVRA